MCRKAVTVTFMKLHPALICKVPVVKGETCAAARGQQETNIYSLGSQTAEQCWLLLFSSFFSFN